MELFFFFWKMRDHPSGIAVSSSAVSQSGIFLKSYAVTFSSFLLLMLRTDTPGCHGPGQALGDGPLSLCLWATQLCPRSSGSPGCDREGTRASSTPQRTSGWKKWIDTYPSLPSSPFASVQPAGYEAAHSASSCIWVMENRDT